MKVFFSVGEPSGDLHGANLIRQLRKRRADVECMGYGGPRMAEAGCELHEDLTRLAIMWFLRVLLNIHKFWGLYQRAKRYFRDNRPDAVVLIDYPGFNWWIARAAKKQGIPVFYYGVPQLWGWAGWRVRKMRRFVDHVLCKLPFEAEWYRQKNCNATYVGHPYFDELESRSLDQAFLKEYGSQPAPLVAILPGSRTQEVTKNLRWFLKAAQRVHEDAPEARFAIASFNEKQAEVARNQVAEADLPIDVFVDRTPELVHLSHCTMACSGSVSLELLYHTKPTVILYWIQRYAYWVATALFMKVRFITLVNLLATDDPFVPRGARYDAQRASKPDVPFPEYLTYEDRSEEIANYVLSWLTDEDAYEQRVRRLSQLKAEHTSAGASSTAADYILSKLPPPLPSAQDSRFELTEMAQSRKIPA